MASKNIQEMKKNMDIYKYFATNSRSNIYNMVLDLNYIDNDKSILDIKHEQKNVCKKSIKHKLELNKYFNTKDRKKLNNALCPLHLNGTIDEINLIPIITNYLYF